MAAESTIHHTYAQGRCIIRAVRAPAPVSVYSRKTLLNPLNPFAPRNPPKPDIAAALRKRLHERGEQLINQVVLIDEMLVDLDKLLNILQPPRNGKIRIEWEWIDDLKKPRAAVWERKGAQKRGKWNRSYSSTNHLPLRAKRSRLFWDNRKIVVELLTLAQTLMVTRSNLIQSITNLDKSAQQKLASITPKANVWREQLNETFRNLDTMRRFDLGDYSFDDDEEE